MALSMWTNEKTSLDANMPCWTSIKRVLDLHINIIEIKFIMEITTPKLLTMDNTISVVDATNKIATSQLLFIDVKEGIT